MTPNDRFVTENESGGWDVTKAGHRRATAHSTTRSGAVRKATTLTRREGGGEVAVLNRYGKAVSVKNVPGPSAARGRAAA